MKKEIVFVESINPTTNEAAGIKTYIMNIINSLDHSFELVGVGLNTKKNKLNYKFRSLFNNKSNSLINKVFPLSLRFVYSLFKQRSNLGFRGKIIHVHRIDTAIPLLYSRDYKLFLTMHGITSVYLSSKFIFPFNFFIKQIYTFLETIVFHNADKIIVVSQFAYNYYIKKYSNIKHKFVYIPPGINRNKFYVRNKAICRKKVKLNVNNNVALYIGRLDKIKRVNFLIRTFKNNRNLHFVIFGNGKLETKLKHDIIEQKIKNISLHKALPHSKIPLILNCADIVCLASTFEGTPLVVLEALTCGIPVISTNVGDIPFILNNSNGIIVEKTNLDKYGQLAVDLINKKINRAMCRSSVSNYDLRMVSKQLNDLYEEEV